MQAHELKETPHDAFKKTHRGKYKVTIAWALMVQSNVTRLKERHDWAIIYRVSTANKFTRQKRVGATTREFTPFILA